MTAAIVVERRFRGPAASGNGGYTCGLIAEVVGIPLTARLTRPLILGRLFVCAVVGFLFGSVGCATSGECCSGFCRDTGSGPMCVPPGMVEWLPAGTAHRLKNADSKPARFVLISFQ